jgi:hypothetical protein
MFKMFVAPSGLTDFSHFFIHLVNYHFNEVTANNATPAPALLNKGGSSCSGCSISGG